MKPFLFHEKVHRPDPRGLARDRLEGRLLDPDGPRTALVLGPPGAGKTTLLSRVAARDGEPCAWYRASAEDDDESALVRHVGRAIEEALGVDLVRLPAAETTVDGLLAGLEAFQPGPLRLVVDDVHSIAGSPAERGLERLLLLRPPAVRVLLGSRRPLQINTSRLLANGDLCQLDGEDLRFRSWEVEDLFRTVYQRPLSPESAAALTRRTGGWAAGLQLFHLGTAELTRHGRESAVAQLSGRSRLIRSYLTRNVLEGLDDERRQFLLRTCTLGELTGGLCDLLLGRTGSAAVLDELERLQFFTTSTDGGHTYRYHQVLQTHLEVLLVDEWGAAASTALYVRSAELLEREGRASAAVRAYARAEDWGAVARLLQEGGSSLPAEEYLGNLLGRPGVPLDDPGLGVAGARRLLRDGRLAEAVAAYRQAESLMDDPEFRARCAEERAAAAVWLPDSPDPVPGAPPGSPALELACQLRALTRIGSPPPSVASGLVRGLGHLVQGDPAAAVRTIAGSLTTTGTEGWQNLAGRLVLVVAESLTHPDDTVEGRLEEIVLSADLGGLPWLSRIARGVQAEVLLTLRPSSWRAAACRELIEDREHHQDGWAVCLLSGLLGWLHLRTGHADQAVAELRRSLDHANALGASLLALWVMALLTRTPAVPESTPERVELLAHRARAAGLSAVLPILSGDGIPPLTVHWELPSPAAAADATLPRTGAKRHVRLLCLGGFELVVDDRPVDWRSLRPKARALLQRLAVDHGRPVHRERLIDALWPETTLAAGTRSLQVAVSSVRQCLVAAGLEEGLRREGDAYALRLPGALDQLREFERLVRVAARYEATDERENATRARFAALDLYAGELLPEAGPAEWVVGERDRLRSLAAEVAADAARGALAAGELAPGVRAARRSLELEPYHDPSWRVLVELLERLGDHGAAAVCRRDHARALAELGLPVLVDGSAPHG
jgi:DNA-binding SARP family transcriptional activator